ncbi:MAG: hypothetical protein IKO98_10225 [Bacteroidales bacterium]|nr:hypothetical protein [Bacteroidales bacterium]
MDKVTAYFHGELMRIKKEDPERFQYIHDYECPHHYGLPSYQDKHTCEQSTCEQCWNNAMGFSGRNRRKKTAIRMVWERIRSMVQRFLKKLMGRSGKC